jgi:acyl transferase domain-containing protein
MAISRSDQPDGARAHAWDVRSPIAFLFPGQGGFDAAALRAAAARHPQVREVFGRIDMVTTEMFGRRLGDIVLDGPLLAIDELLADESWVSQLAIYGSGLAAFEILISSGVTPAVLLGHSLGEVVAIVAAGAFTVADGARLVIRRVQVIEQLGQVDGRMVALGTGADRAARLVGLLEDPMLAIATVNSDRQTVVSGPAAAIERVLAIADTLSMPARALNAAFPFHTPLLAPAVEPFASYVRTLEQRPMRYPVLSPILGRYYRPDDSLADLLSRHFVLPVDFASALRRVHADGGRIFVETGGKAVLTRLTSTIIDDPSVRAFPSLVMRHGELALTDSLRDLQTTVLA